MEAEQSVLPLAHGSARVKLGATEVLASVKLELGVPASSSPDKGRIAVSVDFPSRFFSRSPSKLRLDDVSELTRTLESLFTGSGSIDMRALCIAPKQHCWVVWVDLLVLECGGSLLDAMSLAIHAALQDTRLPRVHVIGDAAGAVEVEVDEDPTAQDFFPVSGIPVVVSFLQVADYSIVDACDAEEACADASIRIAINRLGEVCSVLVDGEMHLSPALVHEAVESARTLAPALYARVAAATKRQSDDRVASGVASWLSTVGTSIIGADQTVAVPA